MSELDDILGMAAAEAPSLPDNEQVKGLTQKCEQLVDIRRRLALASKVIEDLNKEEQRLSSQEIPNMMIELGLQSIKLNNGQTVGYKPFYSGKIIPENQDEAFDWLEESGHGGVVKGTVSIQFRRPQRDDAIKLKYILASEGWDTSINLSVHHSTLRALFKEVIESGGTFPSSLFDLFIGNQTTIK